MKSLSLRMSVAALAVLVIIGLAGCMNPLARISGGAKSGGLTVSFSNAINARTLLPGISMNVGSYSISGSGPGGASFSGSSTGAAVSFQKLAFGTWTVSVDAYNDAAPAVMIGSGSATATVRTGETTGVTVTVVPLPGTGTLSLNVSWNAGDIETPSIDASLIPTTGSTRNLNFTFSGASAHFSATDVATGYHTLTLQLLDNGIVTAGAVEMVRIVKAATTSGSFAFTQVNKPGGTIDVNIDPKLADPIDVTMSGVASSIAEGQTMTVSASVPAGTPNVSYVWYLNGASVGTGSPFTFGSTLAAGHYRLDVTAITADGTRAGSATESFDVSAGTAVTSTALWARTVSAGSGESAFEGVAVDASGNVYAAGFQVGPGPYTYGSGVTVTGSDNVVLVKYDASGAAQWAQIASGGTGGSDFKGVAVDASGNVYAAGEQGGNGTGTYTYGPGVSATGSGDGTSNVVLVKYDASGAAQWAQTVSAGTSDSWFTGVAVDAAGNVYAAGVQTGTGTYTYGTGVSASASFSGDNVVLVKYDAPGVAQWARTVSAGTDTSRFTGVAVDAAGNVYAAGYQGTGSYTYGTGVSASGTGIANVVLVKYDASGAAQWAQTVSAGTLGSQFYGVAVDASGNVYAAGYQGGTEAYTYGPGVSATGSCPGNPVLVKYDASGTAQWAQTLSAGAGGGSDYLGVGVDASGNVYAVGEQEETETYTYGPGVSATGTSSHNIAVLDSGQNAVLVKYDASGAAQWAQTVNAGTSNSWFYGVAVNASGNAYAAGYQYGNGTYTYGTGVSATGTSIGHNVLLVKYGP